MKMNTALKETNPTTRQRRAEKRHLEKLFFTVSSLSGIRDIPACARSWIPFISALIKLGFTGWKASTGSIVDAQYRSSSKGNKSESSAYSAFKWLRENGWIRKQECKLESDRGLCIYDFDLEHFEFIVKSTTAPPIPTSVKITHKDTQLQILEGLEGTKKDPVSSSTSVTTWIDCKDWAKSTGIKNPVKTSIKYVLFRKTPWPIDAGRVLRRVDLELSGKVEPSVDWKALERRWSGLLHSERENIARSEILPALRLALIPGLKDADLTGLVQTLVGPASNPFVKSTPGTPEHLKNTGILHDREFEALAKAQERLLWSRKNSGNY